MKPAGERAEKLLARNAQLRHKAEYFEQKLRNIKAELALNQSKSEALLKDERKSRKFKVE